MDVKAISKRAGTKESPLGEEGPSSVRTRMDEPILKRKLQPGLMNLGSLEKRGKRQKVTHKEFNVKRVQRGAVGDFWSRVDSGEIPIKEDLDKMKSTPIVITRRDEDLPNYNIITTCVADYSYKTTPFGDVYYSPRFQDERYIYRYVILTKGVRNEAYRILKSSRSFLLTEHQIIRELGIDLSPGWEHFMLFRNRLDEIILRRKLI